MSETSESSLEIFVRKSLKRKSGEIKKEKGKIKKSINFKQVYMHGIFSFFSFYFIDTELMNSSFYKTVIVDTVL